MKESSDSERKAYDLLVGADRVHHAASKEVGLSCILSSCEIASKSSSHDPTRIAWSPLFSVLNIIMLMNIVQKRFNGSSRP
jgi:hypothetical protein